MRFHLALALVVATIAPAVPAAEATQPIPSLEDVLHVTPGTLEDYCVWEVQADGTRRKVACAPAGRLPVVESDILIPPV